MKDLQGDIHVLIFINSHAPFSANLSFLYRFLKDQVKKLFITVIEPFNHWASEGIIIPFETFILVLQKNYSSCIIEFITVHKEYNLR